MQKTPRSRQAGGFVLGMVVGLLIGLALSLGVALYISKVPVPFVDKVPQRTAEQDAAEAEKNKNWDPNAPLAGKSAGRAASAVMPSPAAVPAPAPAPLATPAPAATPAPTAPAIAAQGGAVRPAASAAPNEPSAKAGAQPFQYFVQVGAYTRNDEAEQQRARLAINGLTAKVTEREQAGHTMYRVRLGPFEVREEADKAKEQAAGIGFSDAALVRVAR